MPMIDSLLAELDNEAAITRRVLERVPDEKLSWKPHEKSMTLGRIAGHLAELPRWGGTILRDDLYDLAAHDGEQGAVAGGREDALASFDESVAAFKEGAAGVADEKLFQNWQLRRGETVVVDLPRIAAVRGFVLNHMIHHRGQLSVYLRLLDVPVPSIYGPSADEGTFG